MAGSSLTTRAIVLRRTNYGEADRVLSLLTPEGRLSVIARGVRREKSKLAGGIELFAVSDIVVHRGRGQLSILTSARLVHFYRQIMADYERMTFAYRAVSLVASASETIDEPEWFDLLVEVFAGLDTASLSRRLVETWFYIRYAAILGHELNLSIDAEGEALVADQAYRYDSNEQSLVKRAGGNITTEHIKLLRLISTKSLTILAQVGGLDEIIGDCLAIAHQHAAVD
ncbi:DNA repair protein RecO [Candidatus Saccharibacteria bacterium 32-49-12]|nr:MAG: DNA repair protein RecO [Candidatus Saccharibacteria bacterium 32-49-12]